MEELKKLYLAPEAELLCFKAIERLAGIGNGVVDEENGSPFTPSADPQDPDINGE